MSAAWVIAFLVVYVAFAVYFSYDLSEPVRRHRIWALFGPAFNSVIQDSSEPSERFDSIRRWLATSRRLRPADSKVHSDVLQLLDELAFAALSYDDIKFKRRFKIERSPSVRTAVRELIQYVEERYPFRDLPPDQGSQLTRIRDFVVDKGGDPSIVTQAAAILQRANLEIKGNSRLTRVSVAIGVAGVALTLGAWIQTLLSS